MKIDEIKQRVVELQDIAKKDMSVLSQLSNDKYITLLVESDLNYSSEHLNRALQKKGEPASAEILKAEAHAKRAVQDALITWATYNNIQLKEFAADYKNYLHKSQSYSKAFALQQEINNHAISVDDIDLNILRNKLEMQNDLLGNLLAERSFFNKLVSEARRDKISFLIVIVSAISGVISLLFSIDQIMNSIPNFFSNLFGSVMTIGTAYASTEASVSNPSVGTKEIFNLMFTSSVLIAFFWSFLVSIHNNSNSKRQTAKSYAHLFGGILIGSAKSTLGL